MAFIAFLITLASSILLLNAKSTSDETFDYVIIGGGTAGLVVAARLSENPSVTVAVIEAGIYHVNDSLVDTPELFGQAIGNPDYDWNLVTVPQVALNNSVLSQPRGKMLGGSSGLNFMAWDRASAQEYDAWEQLGATGWNWTTLLPYFKKSEAVEAPPSGPGIFPGAMPEPEVAFDEFHGRSGVIQPSYANFYSNLSDPYVETINNLGIETNSDPYTGNATGVYNTEASIDRVKDVGQRSYSANTYYNISANRPNLHVFLSTLATKIIFTNDSQDQTSLRATGVQIMALNSSGASGIVHANKEVIISAGSLQTPQILELSGVGNKTILESAGIESLMDLPGVGENLQDHAIVVSDFQVLDEFATFDKLRNNMTFLAEQEEQYAINHTGLLANIYSALVFLSLSPMVPEDVLETIHQNATSMANDSSLSPLTKKQYGIQLDHLLQGELAQVELVMFPFAGLGSVSPTPNDTYISIISCIMRPWARGSVHIGSDNSTAQPLINPNYVDNPVDLQIELEAVKFARTIASTAPLAQFVVAPHDPPANVTTDADFLAFMKEVLGTEYHPVGTAAMLPQELGGVVDPETLKVYGTQNVRVVDASLIPLQIAAHIQSTVYAIAERASDIIKTSC